MTDSSGASNTTYAQEPFGKTTKAGASINSFQFTGRENDETGLYYYRARYYSTSLNRFIGEDPLELASGDTNFYAYVFDSPINYVDPSGLYSIDELVADLPTLPQGLVDSVVGFGDAFL